MKNINLDDETILELEFLGYDITTIKNVFTLFASCIEEGYYCETKVELYNFAKVLNYFIEKVKKDYENIQDKLDIPR